MSNTSKRIEEQKDNAYWERNQLVAALSKIFPAHLAKHPEEDKDWENDWRTIVAVIIPVEATKYRGQNDKPVDFQLSWHVHDHEIPMFDHLEYKEFWWDGHSTEEKYRRLRLLDQLNKESKG